MFSTLGRFLFLVFGDEAGSKESERQSGCVALPHTYKEGVFRDFTMYLNVFKCIYCFLVLGCFSCSCNAISVVKPIRSDQSFLNFTSNLLLAWKRSEVELVSL